MNKKEILNAVLYYKKRFKWQWLSIDDLIQIIQFDIRNPKAKKMEKYDYTLLDQKLL